MAFVRRALPAVTFPMFATGERRTPTPAGDAQSVTVR